MTRPRPQPPALKSDVLFVCTRGAGRSQMAQAFFERIAPADVHAVAAGSEPADAVWPTVVEAMREVGIDISERRPQRLDSRMQASAAWVVSMGCGDRISYVTKPIETWPLPDPAEKPLVEVRAIRDDIERRVDTLVGERLEEIRSGGTALQRGLAELLPLLDAEHGECYTADEIRSCTDQKLAQFGDAPISSFVFTLTRSLVGDCLAAGQCATAA